MSTDNHGQLVVNEHTPEEECLQYSLGELCVHVRKSEIRLVSIPLH